MGNMTRPGRFHAWIDTAVGFGIVVAGSALAFLLPDALLVFWCVPTGLSLGVLVRPGNGALLRLFSVLVGGFCAYRAIELVNQPAVPGRVYVLALSVVVLAGAAFFTFRSGVRVPPPKGADTVTPIQ
jgi:hypothetical protein